MAKSNQYKEIRQYKKRNKNQRTWSRLATAPTLMQFTDAISHSIRFRGHVLTAKATSANVQMRLMSHLSRILAVLCFIADKTSDTNNNNENQGNGHRSFIADALGLDHSNGATVPNATRVLKKDQNDFRTDFRSSC